MVRGRNSRHAVASRQTCHSVGWGLRRIDSLCLELHIVSLCFGIHPCACRSQVSSELRCIPRERALAKVAAVLLYFLDITADLVFLLDFFQCVIVVHLGFGVPTLSPRNCGHFVSGSVLRSVFKNTKLLASILRRLLKTTLLRGPIIRKKCLMGVGMDESRGRGGRKGLGWAPGCGGEG